MHRTILQAANDEKNLLIKITSYTEPNNENRLIILC